MCGGVVEELSDGDGGCFCAFGLGGSEGAECDEHSGVNCAGIIEEDSDDLLEASERFGRERWGGVVGVGVLDCGLGADVGEFGGLVRRSQALRCRRCGGRSPRRGSGRSRGCCPVGGDGVERLEGVDEVLGVVVSDVFDSEVVND